MRLSFPFALILLAALVVFCGGEARAQNNGEDPCIDPQSSAQQFYCAEKKFKEATVKLDNVSRLVLVETEDNKAFRRSFQRAQAAWRSVRAANCDFEAFLNRGGTIHPLIYTECMTRMTESRTRELQLWLDNLHEN